LRTKDLPRISDLFFGDSDSGIIGAGCGALGASNCIDAFAKQGIACSLLPTDRCCDRLWRMGGF
jgi:hypothetical protein